MESLRKPDSMGPAFRKTGGAALLGCAVILLAASSWMGLLPTALGREAATAADLMTAQLPGRKTLKTATKSEFLGAVCAAVRKRRSAAAAITQAAVTARRESAGEIVGAVLRCGEKINCESVKPIVAAATAAEGDPLNIADAAMAKAPNCAETIRDATRREAKAIDRAESEAAEQGPLIGTSNGPDEGFDPHEELKLVCDDGTPRAVRASLLEGFLRSNPGSSIGPCPTPARTER